MILGLLLACLPHPAPTEPVVTAERSPAEVQLALADALAENGNTPAALALVSRLERDGGDGPELAVVHIKALRLAGLSDTALSQAERATRRWPRESALWNELGVLRMDHGDKDSALPAFERAATGARPPVDHLNNLGFCLLSLGRVDESIAVFERAVEVDGSSRRVLYNLGLALVIDGREAQARRVVGAAADSAEADRVVAAGRDILAARTPLEAP